MKMGSVSDWLIGFRDLTSNKCSDGLKLIEPLCRGFVITLTVLLIANMILASYDYKTHILFLIFSLFQMLEASIRASSGFQNVSVQK